MEGNSLVEKLRVVLSRSYGSFFRFTSVLCSGADISDESD